MQRQVVRLRQIVRVQQNFMSAQVRSAAIHVCRHRKDVDHQIAFFHNSQEGLVPPEDLDPSVRNLVVFDDVLLDKQRNIERYFAQGRHANADVFYCSQSYTRVPKQVIRDNANLLILFPQDELNLKRIFENHVCGDMEFSEFTALCRSCWNRPFSFLTIDKTLKKDRYKRMFNRI